MEESNWNSQGKFEKKKNKDKFLSLAHHAA